jgi:hypothetical protein
MDFLAYMTLVKQQARWKSKDGERRGLFGDDEPLKSIRMCINTRVKSQAFHEFGKVEPYL